MAAKVLVLSGSFGVLGLQGLSVKGFRVLGLWVFLGFRAVSFTVGSGFWGFRVLGLWGFRDLGI